MRMLDCYSSEDILSTLMELGDGPDLSIERPFGKLNLRWRAYGGTASNISTIGLATKPGKSLTERVTNAIDAVLEDRSMQSNSANRPDSPRQAAQDWFGRPMSGPDTGLFQGMPTSTDRRISVVLLPSGIEDRPTVDVLDAGSGIVPQDFQKTILSLQAGNKITKRYQIGAFGQGGSSTLAFADYVLIVSRCKREPTKCGFTVVRVLKLDASYKEDCYAYLATEDGEPFIAEVAQGERLTLYKSEGDTATPFLEYGTLVRHVNYRLSGISKSLQASPGNLYHYLHYSLFDPVLPFRVWDIRDPSRLRSEYVGGSRNRLLSRSISAEGSGNVQVRHYRPMEYIVPAGGDTPCIGIEYWVVLAFRKQGESEDVLRANSAELFVQNGHPIVGTLNGQTQGELTAQLFKEIGLGLLARHAIVHIDASAADSRVRRELFATSREGFKEGPVLDSISTCLRRMLEEDEDLVADHWCLPRPLYCDWTWRAQSFGKRRSPELLPIPEPRTGLSKRRGATGWSTKAKVTPIV